MIIFPRQLRKVCGAVLVAAPPRFGRRAAPANRRTAAFTLVEVALAILAIGLGLLGIFGLGHYGLEATRETANDERCDQFADAVFATLRSYNDYYAFLANSNGVNAAKLWSEKWEQTLNNTLEISFPPIADINTNAMARLVFRQVTPAFDMNNISLLDWNPYYALDGTPSAISSVAGGCNLFTFALVVYPDGNTFSSASRSYTTSLTFTGGTP